VSVNRRDFLKGTAAAAAASAIGAAPAGALTPAAGARRERAWSQLDNRELARRAVDAARQAGASYADPRRRCRR
jgi:anaerobic selenocysteine-containing dehydrogenase